VAWTSAVRLGSFVRAVAAIGCAVAAWPTFAAAPASAATVDPVAAGVPGSGRAWELVTSAEPVAARLALGEHGGGPGHLALGISTSGDRIAYKTTGALPDASFGAIVDTNLAERGADGWSNRTIPYPVPDFVNLTGLLIGVEGPLAFNADLTEAFWVNELEEPESKGFFTGPLGPPYTMEVAKAPSYYRGVSADFSHVFFVSEAHFLPADAGRTSGFSLYEYDAGVLQLVDVDNGGNPISACGSSYADASADGSEVLFTATPNCSSGSAHLYLRAGGHTTDVSASQCTLADCGPEAEPAYLGLSPDGAFVFFSSAQRLTDADNEGKPMVYRYDVASGTLSQLFQQPPEAGASSLGDFSHMVRSSVDGSRVYFFARDRLLPGQGSFGDWNLYLADAGGLHIVAAGAGESVFVTPDGRYAVFTSAERLAPGDTDSSVDVYRYDADTGEIALISAGTDGKGNGAFGAKLPETSRVVDGNRRVVFDTAEPLLPQDRNGKEDVYEWSEAGGLALVSGGVPGLPGAFVGVTPDGGTVFFLTTATLLARDRDQGEADIYAARIGGGLPEPPEPGPAGCSGSECGESLGGGSPRQLSLPRPDLSHRLELGPIDAAARRQLARTGATTLLVEAPAAGRLNVVGRGKGKQPLASGSAQAKDAGPLLVALRLQPAARRALARGKRVSMRILLTLGQARLRGPALTLKQGGPG
jgi:hypothetical protein